MKYWILWFYWSFFHVPFKDYRGSYWCKYLLLCMISYVQSNNFSLYFDHTSNQHSNPIGNIVCFGQTALTAVNVFQSFRLVVLCLCYYELHVWIFWLHGIELSLPVWDYFTWHPWRNSVVIRIWFWSMTNCTWACAAPECPPGSINLPQPWFHELPVTLHATQKEADSQNLSVVVKRNTMWIFNLCHTNVLKYLRVVYLKCFILKNTWTQLCYIQKSGTVCLCWWSTWMVCSMESEVQPSSCSLQWKLFEALWCPKKWKNQVQFYTNTYWY